MGTVSQYVVSFASMVALMTSSFSRILREAFDSHMIVIAYHKFLFNFGHKAKERKIENNINDISNLCVLSYLRLR